MKFEARPLSQSALEVCMQLFINGPTWDGNIVSKAGRGELCKAGLAFHVAGFASLTPEGVIFAAEYKPAQTWPDQRWFKKQNGA